MPNLDIARRQETRVISCEPIAFAVANHDSSLMNEAGANFARVIVPSRFLEPLVYAVPEDLKGSVVVGSRVLIPVGKRKLTGVAVELLASTALAETKQIIALLDDEPIL